MANILVIGPHPDDAELGMGGAIAKLSGSEPQQFGVQQYMTLTAAPKGEVVGEGAQKGYSNPAFAPVNALTRKVEIARSLTDGVAAFLAGLQRIEVEDRLEFDEGAAIGIGQRLIADELAPGERPATAIEHILDRLGDQVEGPLGAVKLDLAALDAC